MLILASLSKSALKKVNDLKRKTRFFSLKEADEITQ